MRSKTQIYIAGFLTWIAGFVDAVGFLAVGQIYTANMSGNSVAIGIRAWQQDWVETLRRAWPIAFYVLGLLIARVWLEIAGRERVKSAACVAFSIEVVVLTPVCFAHSIPHSQLASTLSFVLIALLAFAMGVQNAALTHFSTLTLHTGFVTGTLLTMAERFTKYLTWAYDRFRHGRESISVVLHNSRSQAELRTALLLASLWMLYVAGAFCGAAGQTFFGLICLLIPMAALAIIGIYDLRRPLAAKDENEQMRISQENSGL